MRIVLAGDSHLAYVRRDLHRLGPDVRNLAVGGAVVTDVLRQLTSGPLGPDDAVPIGDGDVVVVSVGTNDAAAYPGVPLAVFEAALDELVDVVRPGRWVYVAPPGLADDDPDDFGRSNDVIATYAAAAAARFDVVVDTLALLAPLGGRARTYDGLHLTGAGYDALLPALAAACR